ncbi:Uncharacterised protein [uncultured archaeon]|nr:Uncharacterised protein [uncultured archaeon]
MGNLISAAALLAVLALAAIFFYYESRQDGIRGQDLSQLCNDSGSANRVFKCGQGVYLVAPLVADLGTRYVDSGGKLLAQCPGFINLPPSAECQKYRAYSCDRAANLCASNNSSN